MVKGKTPTRILIADDHALFRAALRKLIELDPEFIVVREASNGWEVKDLLEKLQPDILLLDVNMPQQSGFEVLRQLANVTSEVRIVLLVEAIDRKQVIEALRLGACGVLHKDTARHLLYKCIRTVMAGEYWIDRHSVIDLVSSFRTANTAEPVSKKPNTYGLTRREFEILFAVVDGCTNKEIAEKLTISEQTVKHHLTRIFGKVGVSNRLELALFAMNQRLVS